MLKKLWKGLFALLCVILVVAVGLVAFLSATEYKPDERQSAEFFTTDPDGEPTDESICLYSWNIGYCGLGKDSDFFMDGGTMVDPPSQEAVESNLAAIISFLQENPADAYLLQEVDVNSSRTDGLDQYERIGEALQGSSAFAYNYKCSFVPYPLPPIGKIASGIATFTSHEITQQAERIALPCPFSWPVSVANLKRCLLITRIPVADGTRELVLVNLHLEAYDDGEGKLAQTKLLLEILQQEYEKGNYVIAGGDFNQVFPDTLESYPIADPESWTPGVLHANDLPESWQYAFDRSSATCRLLDKPYDGTNQLYVIDGFILSPNIQLDQVETVDLGFANSDHNPVHLNVTLLGDHS